MTADAAFANETDSSFPFSLSPSHYFPFFVFSLLPPPFPFEFTERAKTTTEGQREGVGLSQAHRLGIVSCSGAKRGRGKAVVTLSLPLSWCEVSSLSAFRTSRTPSVCLSLSRILKTLLPLRSISPLLLTSCKQMQIALLRPKIASDRRKLASSFLVSLVLFLPPLFLPSLPQIPREAKDYWTKGERCCERTNTTTRAKAPRQPPS